MTKQFFIDFFKPNVVVNSTKNDIRVNLADICILQRCKYVVDNILMFYTLSNSLGCDDNFLSSILTLLTGNLRLNQKHYNQLILYPLY